MRQQSVRLRIQQGSAIGLLSIVFNLGWPLDGTWANAAAVTALQPRDALTARIEHDAPLRYRLAVGDWIQRTASGTGNLPLPLAIETQQARCQLELPQGVMLRADSASIFTLSQQRPGELRLELRQGSVYFSMPEQQQLELATGDWQIRCAAPGPAAATDASQADDGAPKSLAATLTVLPGGTIQWTSLASGSVLLSADGRQWTVQRGEQVTFPAAARGHAQSLTLPGAMPAPSATGNAAGGAAQRKSGDAPDKADPLAITIENPTVSGGSSTEETSIPPAPNYTVDDLPEVGERMSPWTPPIGPRGLPSAPGGESPGSSSTPSRSR